MECASGPSRGRHPSGNPVPQDVIVDDDTDDTDEESDCCYEDELETNV